MIQICKTEKVDDFFCKKKRPPRYQAASLGNIYRFYGLRQRVYQVCELGFKVPCLVFMNHVAFSILVDQ